MTTIIKSDLALLDRLYRAQLECLSGHIDVALGPYGLSDDGHDYFDAAYNLMGVMSTLMDDRDTAGLDALLNNTSDDRLMLNYACDGIADAFSDLDCAAMADIE